MSSGETIAAEQPALGVLDAAAVAFLALPLGIFLIGWLELWVALPLLVALVYALRPLSAASHEWRLQRCLAGWQVALAIAVGCAWTSFGGTGHWVFANADWHIRDAVLHDLVTGAWPVGYGAKDGVPTLLRAPLAYYLPAALVGKAAGLAAAHVALTIWTALGATIFLMQVLSLMPVKVAAALASMALIVSFSGLDVVGTVLRVPAAIAHWDVTQHLEWWAARYQYSSMTTQLFWVPNHALGAWLGIGLLCRQRGADAVDALLPMTVVAVALWSPLAALGLVPFVLLRVWQVSMRERSSRMFHPRVWAPALAVGLVIAAYLTLDAGRIPKGWTLGHAGFGPAAIADDLWRQAEFFLLEAGLLGLAILSIRRSAAVVLALCVLAALPVVSFGGANDFVMRVSIPSLTVLAIGACLALFAGAADATGSAVIPAPAPAPMPAKLRLKQAVLVGLLLIGAVTPFQEFARAASLAAWPANLDATLIDAACGTFPAHYVARLRGQPIAALLRSPHALPLHAQAPDRAASGDCENPALRLERRRAEAVR
jgi:hypothetical protein